MHKLHTLTGIAALAALSLTTVTQGATTIIASSDGQVRDTDQSGTGNSANAGGPLSGRKNSNNIQPLWAFSLASFTPASLISAEFSANVTTISANTDYNLDLHAVRIVDSATFAINNEGNGFLADDWQDSDATIADNFWTVADGLGVVTADMTSYLQGKSWTPTDLLIVSLQQDVPNYLVNSNWTNFETFVEGGTTGATLTVVPEPGTYALLGGLLALGHVMLRRRR